MGIYKLIGKAFCLINPNLNKNRKNNINKRQGMGFTTNLCFDYIQGVDNKLRFLCIILILED